MKTRLFYYTGELNFGDLLNELICEKVLNINYRQSDVYSCGAVFINCFYDLTFTTKELYFLLVIIIAFVYKIKKKMV